MKKCRQRAPFLSHNKRSLNLQSCNELQLHRICSYSKLPLLLVFVIILFCPTLFAQADSLQTTNFSGSGELTPLPDTLDKAIRLAEQKKNPDLFYNLGVEFFSRGEIGMANLYFLKALNINSAHSPARTNLELSIHYSPDADLYPEQLFLVQVLFKVLNYLSVNRLAILGLVFLFLSAVSLCWLLFYNPEKERALPILTLTFCLLLCVSAFVTLSIKLHHQQHNRSAVVIVRETELLSPANNNVIQTVHSGLIVKIVQDNGNYYVVRLPNNQLGRLNKEAVRKVI